MKKHFLIGVIPIMLLLLVTPSSAITIGFDPGSQTVPIGDQAEVALVISGLGDGAAPSLGIFDLDIAFDANILGFSGAAFGDPLLGDQVDMSGDAQFFDSLFGPGLYLGASVTSLGVLNIFEVSVDWWEDLDDNQADAFTLATLTFDTLAVGLSPLDITINTLGDSWGDPLLDAGVSNGSISPVPEPATILLLASGMAGLGVFGRKKFRK